jgi:predicted nucleic acid-binding protein
VVLEELYAEVSSRDHRIIQKIELEFEQANRLLVPNQRDWSLAGQLLNRIANKCGYESIGRSRLTNDSLIASSAARCGIEVITANARDFGRLTEFCPLQWRVG